MPKKLSNLYGYRRHRYGPRVVTYRGCTSELRSVNQQKSLPAAFIVDVATEMSGSRTPS